MGYVQRQGKIQGVSICAGAPSITHLLFADDSLLLKANEENAGHLKHVLQIYECSGQEINKEKSSITFSENTKVTRQKEIYGNLGAHTGSYESKVFGIGIYGEIQGTTILVIIH